MKPVLFFSMSFLSVLSALDTQNFLKNEKLKKFLFFVVLFFLTLFFRETVLADSWTTGKTYGSFNISNDDITFYQDDGYYYFEFDFSHNPYGSVSNNGYILSQISTIGYMQESSGTGSSGVSRTCQYSSDKGGTYYGTTHISATNSGAVTFHEAPSFYIFDNAVRTQGISPSKTFLSDVCSTVLKIDGVNHNCAKVAKSKISLFRYLNARGTRNMSLSGKDTFAMSNAFDLMTLTEHECEFKARYIDAGHHDYYCSICHWSKNLEEHKFDRPDIFGYENHRCACGLHDKTTIRLSIESADGKNISKGDVIDFSDTYKKINNIDFIGTPNSPFELNGIDVEDVPGYIFLGLDPPLPTVFPDESVEFKLIYEPIKYKILYSHDNLSRLGSGKIASSLTSKGSARDLAPGETQKIEEEYGISLDGLVYSMIQDCVYDRQYYLPTYSLYSHVHLGWGSIKNNFNPLYSASSPIKNLTTKNNDVLIFNPVFSYIDSSGSGDTWNNDPIGKREDGSSNIIDDTNNGPGGSGGGGGSGGSGAGPGDSGSGVNDGPGGSIQTPTDIDSNIVPTTDETNSSGAVDQKSDFENKNLEDKSSDDEKSNDEDDSSIITDADAGSNNAGGSGGTDGTGGTGIDTDFNIDKYETDVGNNLYNKISSFGKNSFLSFLSSTSFRKNFEKHLERERLYLENLKRQKISAMVKTVLQRTLIFLMLLLLVIFIRDRKERQKVKKHI